MGTGHGGRSDAHALPVVSLVDMRTHKLVVLPVDKPSLWFFQRFPSGTRGWCRLPALDAWDGVCSCWWKRAQAKRLRCDPSAGSSNDHLLNQCFGNHVPDTFCSCVPRPVTPGPGSNRVFDPGFSATRGKGAGGTCVLEHSGFSTSAPQLDPFPPLDLDSGRTRLSLQVSKAISCFARHPDRPLAGLISADNGSLDVHQIWLH